MLKLGKLVLLLAALLAPEDSFAQSITIQGRVINSGGNPVNGPATKFRVQILSPNANRCVLFDETHVLDLSTSSGLFSINLNNGLGTRDLPTTYTLVQALSNRAGFAVNSSYCASGSGTVTYSPSADDNRKVVIQFQDPATMTTWETIPEMDLNPIPYAIESRSVGGYTATSLLRVVDGSGNPAVAAPLTAAQLTEMQALIGGTSNNYMSSTTGSSTGARLPTVSGNPSAPAAGSIWFDTGSGAMKYFDGSSVQTVGTGSGNGTITGVTAGTGLAGGGTSGAVTVSLGTSGVSANTYGSATAVPVLTVDAYGRITSASTTSITGVLPAGTSGQFLKSDGSSWSSQKITMGDLKSTIGTADLFSSPGCTAAQSLYWDSGTDQIKCQSIAIDASAISGGTIADARLADVGTAGTYKIVTTDAKGRVTSGSNPTTLAGFGITDAVLHGGGITSVSSGALASRPAFGTAGRLYVSTDNLTLYRDSGTAWDIIGAAGGGTTITEVSAGTGLSGGGTSGNVTLNLANVGTAGTYPKVTTDAQGRVTAGAALADTDIPNLNWSKITAGKPTDLNGYGITDAVRNAGSVVSFQAGTSRPAFGTAGRFYFNTSSNVLSYDTGAAWVDITSGGGFAGNLAGDVTGPQGTTVVASVGGSTAANVNAATVLANAATDANTASAIVKRDASGNFAAGAGTLSSLVLKNGANTATISPSTITSSYTLRLPAGQATGNQLLQSDTSGNLSWVNPTAASSTSVTAPITNSGTATAPNIGISQATTSTNGYLSSADWNTFNDKLGKALTAARIWVGNGSNVATDVAPSGDVTMTNAGAFTVTKLQGTAVSSTGPSAGQFLTYSASNWVGKNINLSDLRSTSAGTPALFSSPGCTSAQALYWDSGTDQIKCQSIALDGAAITSGTIADARLPSSVKYWQAATGGINYASGNVGIGVANPQATLNISAGITRDIQIQPSSALSNSSRIEFRHSDNGNVNALYAKIEAGLANGGAGRNEGDLSFWTAPNGTGNPAALPRMVIDAAGRVGVGTTGPAEIFQVGTNSASSSSIVLGASAAQQGAIRLTSDASANWIQSGVDMTGDSKKDLRFSSYFGITPWMTIQSGTGNVAIGTTTGTGKLKVQENPNRYVSLADILSTAGTTSFFRSDDNAGTTPIVLDNLDSTATATHFQALLARFSYTGGASTAVNAGEIRFGKEQEWTSTASTRDSSLTFSTTLDGTMAERMRVTSGGRVGIGTTVPGNRFELYAEGAGNSGRIAARNSGSTGASVLEAQVNDYWSASSYTGTSLYQYGSAATGTTGGLPNANLGMLKFQNGSAGLIYNNNSPIYLATGAAPSPQVTLLVNGNLGVGTSNPSTLLEVAGTVKAANFEGGLSGSGNFNMSPTVTATSGVNTPVGSTVTYNPSGATSAGTVVRGLYGLAQTSSSNSLSNADMRGVQGSVQVTSASPNVLDYAASLYGYLTNGGTGTINSANGVSATINNSSTGTINTAAGLSVAVSNGGGGTITNGYGILINTIQATNKWSIFASDATAPSYFAGRVGIGTNAPSFPLHVTTTTTATAVGDTYPAYFENKVGPATNSSASNFGTLSYAVSTTNVNLASLSAAYNAAHHNSTGTATNVNGTLGVSRLTGGGTATYMAGGSFSVEKTGAGTITNGYGVNIPAVAGTNAWAVYASAPVPNYFAGNVGIGTNVAGAPLTVQGSGGTAHQVLIDSSEIKLDGTGYTHYSLMGAKSGRNYFSINNTSAGPATGIAGTVNFSIQPNGYVGIGTSTARELLDIGGGHYMHTGGALAHAFNAYYDVNTWRFAGYGGTAYAGSMGFDPTNGKFTIASTSTSGANAAALTWPARLSITKDGAMGVNNNTPVAPLDVKPILGVSETLRLWGLSAGEGGQISLMDGQGSGAWEIDNYNFDGAERFRIFRDKGEGNVSEPFVISINGNVGIGSSTPAHKLIVSAPTGMHGIFAATADPGAHYAVFGQAGSYSGGIGRADGYSFVGVGTIWNSGNGLFNQSDGRYKENITPLESSLSRLMKLRPVSYTWKKHSSAHEVSGSAPQFGLIAQEVKKVIPEIVILNQKPPSAPTKDGSKTLEETIGESYGVEYTKIIPFLIKAVQELKTQLDAAVQSFRGDHEEVVKLKAENAELKAYLCAKDPQAPFCPKRGTASSSAKPRKN